MQIIADMHMHTNVTDHAFSTLTEMVQAAAERGLAAIAITNHGPTNPDGPHEWHFSNLDLIPRQIGGVTVIRGIEFDITAPAGGINVISNKSLRPIKFALASFHECLFPPADKTIHTQALEAILYNPYVNAFGHLGKTISPLTMNISSAAATTTARSSRSTMPPCPSARAAGKTARISRAPA